MLSTIAVSTSTNSYEFNVERAFATVFKLSGVASSFKLRYVFVLKIGSPDAFKPTFETLTVMLLIGILNSPSCSPSFQPLHR